jgi:hypothetical protein
MSCTESEQLKEVLRTSYDVLVQELKVSKYLDKLFARRVIDLEDEEKLRKEQLECDRARKLLRLLLCKPAEAISIFFEILRTSEDKQPHLYKKLVFPETDTNNRGTWQQDGTATTSCASSTSYESKPGSQWKEDDLPQRHFPTAENHGRNQLSESQGLQSEQESSEADVLRLHVKDTVTVLLSPEKEIKVIIKDQSSGLQGISAAPPTIGKLENTDCVPCQQQRASVSMSNVPSTSRKRKQSFGTVSRPCKLRGEDWAMFFFKSEQQKFLERIQNIILTMCCQDFQIDREQVWIYYISTVDLHNIIESRREGHAHHCIVGIDSGEELAILLVDGIEQEKVERLRKALRNFILTQSQRMNYNPQLKLDARVVEIFSGFSVDVLCEVDVETDVHEITEIPTELDASLQETSLEQQAAAAIETDNGSLLGATHNTSVTLRGAKCEGHIYRVYYRKVQSCQPCLKYLLKSTSLIII